MQHIKEIVKVILWPILLGIGQFIIVLLLTLQFEQGILHDVKKNHPDYSDTQIQTLFQKTVKQETYTNQLAIYLNDATLYIVAFDLLILAPLFYILYRKRRMEKDQKVSLSSYFRAFLLAISLAISCNIIIFGLEQLFSVTGHYQVAEIAHNLWYLILRLGITGPILEELVFRGIMFQTLQKKYSVTKAIVFTSLIFAIFHGDITTIVYTFIIGMSANYLLVRCHSLKVAIFFHGSANLMTLLLVPVLQTTGLLWLVISAIIFGILAIYLESQLINSKR